MGIGAKMAGGNSAVGRKTDDFYATIDTDVTETLLQHFRFGDRKIHECACGTGEMAEIIKIYGYQVISTDLVDREYGEGGVDFLALKNPMAPVVITNPPFKIANKFIEHGMGILKLDAMALLLKSTYFHAARRKTLFDDFPPVAICPLLWRPDFSGQGSPTMEFTWFIWKRGFAGHPSYRLLEKPKASRLVSAIT